MSVKNNLLSIKEGINSNVCLVAVSKTKPKELILEAYESGHTVFGENKVQELVDKYEALPKDIKWHMIGHLQTNKVKYIAPFINLIHSIDSIKLIKEINKKAKSNDRVIDCLIQVHIAKEDSKFGIPLSEVDDFYIKCQEYENVRIKGLMGMATFTENTTIVSEEFKNLKIVYDKMKSNYPTIDILSCGMSGDYNIAIEQGSNMIRIGSTIFGGRQ
ncbi:MAG: YggS family pyridoxal phosphate-dependent enzyme [Flavobacteriales bacterium]